MALPTEGRQSPPLRKKNKEVRGREWLVEDEVDSLRRIAAGLGRHGHRDATMILLAYTHGLRVNELLKVRWDQVDLKHATFVIQRLKGSISGTHPLRRIEVTALKKLAGDRRGLVFRSERGAGLSASGFRKIVARAGEAAELGFTVHPHMLRHGCGYKLTNDGHDIRVIQAWLGHAEIQNTVLYTAMAPGRFAKQKFWED
jgi:type 1 fimbriae regulatory protein FimE